MATIVDIEKLALALPEKERATLAANLLESLASVLSNEDEGIVEALRRHAESEANPDRAIFSCAIGRTNKEPPTLMRLELHKQVASDDSRDINHGDYYEHVAVVTGLCRTMKELRLHRLPDCGFVKLSQETRFSAARPPRYAASTFVECEIATINK